MATVLEHPNTNAKNDGTSGAALKEAPNNLEAEQAVLGAILANNEALNHVGSSLEAEDFYAGIHQRIFKAIKQFNDKGLIANPVTLKHHFAGAEGVEDHYLARLVGSATSIINIHDYARIIRDLAIKRRLIGIGETTVVEAFNPQSEHAGITLVEMTEQQLFKLATEGDGEGGFKPLKNAVVEALNRTEKAFQRSGAVVGVDTGFKDMNRVLGGLHPSDLLILAGRPAMGKTALATTMAYNAAKALANEDMDAHARNAKPRSVGFFSLEMSGEQLAMRLLAAAGGISSHKLQRGDLTQEEFQRLVESSTEMANLPLHIDDTPALTIGALRSRARRLKRVHNVALLVIDYLQLVRPSSSNGQANRVQEVSEITQGLKAIAKELDIPVIALSQLSRAVESRDDKRPQLADLRESGSIEQDADIVMFVYREEYYMQRTQPREGTPEHSEWQNKMAEIHGLADVIIAKHRNGPVDTVTLQFQSELTRFMDHVKPDHLPEQYY
ncbi:MAG: replicative DNA helicase [Alphaproteobacteria bacterium]|nr:replicative DNA helicase [Alphaproteobacteria bacterium]